jgi:dUTP pyrophosphatase
MDISKEEVDKIFENYYWSNETLLTYHSKLYASWTSIINIKLLNEDAKMPTKAYDSDAGWDLYASEDIDIPNGMRKTVKTGVSMAIPDGYVGLIWPRSGLSVKSGVDVLAGVIDASYRGEIMVCLLNTDTHNWVNFKKGDRIAQILFQEVPKFRLYQVAELDTTKRAEGGFGSSGK